VMPLIILGVSGACFVIVMSSIVWMIERVEGTFVTGELLDIMGRGRPDNVTKGTQDLCFGTIPAASWFVITTMTTVGYGDCSPISTVGKLAGMITMVAGVIVLALPITVLGSNFAKVTEMYEEDAARFSLQDYNVDGIIDETEVREFLLRTKREGLLRKDIDTSIPALFDKYDPEARGYLDMDGFSSLKMGVMSQTKDPIGQLHDILDRRLGSIEDSIRLLAAKELGAEDMLQSPAEPRCGSVASGGTLSGASSANLLQTPPSTTPTSPPGKSGSLLA